MTIPDLKRLGPAMATEAASTQEVNRGAPSELKAGLGSICLAQEPAAAATTKEQF